jgi:hypothetical protein
MPDPKIQLIDALLSQFLTIREAANNGMRILSILKGDPDNEELADELRTFGATLQGVENGKEDPSVRIQQSTVSKRSPKER